MVFHPVDQGDLAERSSDSQQSLETLSAELKQQLEASVPWQVGVQGQRLPEQSNDNQRTYREICGNIGKTYIHLYN